MGLPTVLHAFCVLSVTGCSQEDTPPLDGDTSHPDVAANRPESKGPWARPLANMEPEYEDDRDWGANSWPVLNPSEQGRLPMLVEELDQGEHKFQEKFNPNTSTNHRNRKRTFTPSTRQDQPVSSVSISSRSSSSISSSSSPDSHGLEDDKKQ